MAAPCGSDIVVAQYMRAPAPNKPIKQKMARRPSQSEMIPDVTTPTNISMNGSEENKPI